MNSKLSTFLVIAFPLAVMGATFWWSTQKWHACNLLFDNTSAKIICLIS